MDGPLNEPEQRDIQKKLRISRQMNGAGGTLTRLEAVGVRELTKCLCVPAPKEGR